jgi:hypothetical protein
LHEKIEAFTPRQRYQKITRLPPKSKVINHNQRIFSRKTNQTPIWTLSLLSFPIWRCLKSGNTRLR